jgi:hypothetical protein
VDIAKKNGHEKSQNRILHVCAERPVADGFQLKLDALEYNAKEINFAKFHVNRRRDLRFAGGRRNLRFPRESELVHYNAVGFRANM